MNHLDPNLEGLLWPFVFMIGTGLVLLWGWACDIVIEGWRARQEERKEGRR